MGDDALDKFIGYYINFQTPFLRNQLGFHTNDLELDIVIDPQFTWSIKDEYLYKLGLREGCITNSQNTAIEDVKPDIFAMITGRHYPLDGSWVDWRPDPDWKPSRLPEGWDKSDGRPRTSLEKVKND